MTPDQKEGVVLQLKRLTKNLEHEETHVSVSHGLLKSAVRLIETQSEAIGMLNNLYDSAKREQLTLCGEVGKLKQKIRDIDPEREP